MANKKNKKQGGMVFSTNPDFKPSDYIEDDTIDTLPAGKQNLRVLLDRKNRKGKTVTLITGFEGKNDDLNELAKKLKGLCGAGGSAKEGEILIQGDFRDRVLEYLHKNGYTRSKKSGG
jgi:translation initiation factor 1